MLVGEPLASSLSVALQVLKRKTSRKLDKMKCLQFWQRRYYDFNVHSEFKTVEKLRYMHRNPGAPAHELCALGWKPVRRGLVEKPEDWPWSSFVHYATGAAGAGEIEPEWTAQRREANKMLVSGQLCSPPFAKNAKDGAPAVLVGERE